MASIVVFSHLRWDFVYQRPQQLLSRLSKHYQILFIEEPVFHEGESFNQFSSPLPNISVCKPHIPVNMPGFHDDHLLHMQKMVRQAVAGYENPVVWFYTPMALPLLQEVPNPRLVVYDCMDELASFKNPPKQLVQREKALMQLADIVFTGGPSLYQAKRELHPNVHCFSSSVDVDHFSQALDRSISHAAHDGIPAPRLGFFGVIDERFDAELIGKIADEHPDWQLIMVGPVVKIDQATLPQRPNIHYLGQQSYAELPKFVAGWDVCLMPFAINEATRFISPTKTLEYMAAELPIVSTPITDVAMPYGDVVAIAGDAKSFISACREALAASEEEKNRRVEGMRAIVSATSWDATSRQMRELLESAKPRQAKTSLANSKPLDPGLAELSAKMNPKVNPIRKQTPMQSTQCIIIGAGPTGLSAAYHLGKDTLLLDSNATVGGWCRSVQDKGFTFDYAGHIMFSNDSYVQQLYQTLLGSNLHWQDREAWIHSKGVHTRYPFQGALYGLPPSVIKDCILGAIEARYGSSEQPAVASETYSKAGGKPSIKVADDSGKTMDAGDPLKKSDPKNFEEFIYKVWGTGIAKHFAIPYNKKIWTVPLSEMETSWLGGRVPLPNLSEMIDGALEPVPKPMGPNARFGYPLQGGFQSLMSGFLPHIKGNLEMNAQVVQVSPINRTLALADGRRFNYDHLISTMPLPELVKIIGDEAPEEVRKAAQELTHISIRCVNIGIGRENVTDKHWIYYPEDTVFHRIFVQGNASPSCNPPGGFGITCEISYSPYKPLPCEGQSLIDRCIQECIKVGIMQKDDPVVTAHELDMPYAYVIYDHARARNVATVKDWLAGYDIVLAGRYSEWEYYNSDHALLAGKKAADTVAAKIAQPVKSALAE